MPPPTYAASSYQYGFFITLNGVRQSLGLGLLAQNADLDTAAQAHADYLALNYDPATMSGLDPSTGLLYAHSEDAGNPGFYGATPASRDALAGYAYSTSEVAGTLIGADADNGAVAVRMLLNTVYHRAAILSDAPRNIGIGANANGNSFETSGWGLADLGFINPAEQLAPGTTFEYPADGATGATPYFQNSFEAPEPVPSEGASTPLGPPISLQIPSDDQLTVNSFTLTDSGGNPVTVVLRDLQTDASGYMPANVAFIVPTAPLALGAKYTASFSGADGVVPVNATWSFTTASSVTVNTQGPYVVHNGGALTLSASAPSGFVGVQYTSSLSSSELTVAYSSLESVTFSVAAGAVSGPTTLHVVLSDEYMSSAPDATVDVTVEP